MGLREDLRGAVRNVWNTDEGFNMQENLKGLARSTIKDPYKECAKKPAKEYAKCLRDVAKAVDLRGIYRQAWGTK